MREQTDMNMRFAVAGVSREPSGDQPPASIRKAADGLIQRHGDKAAGYAAEMADRSVRNSDVFSVEVWKRIRAAIEDRSLV